jgi:hypothetical protein
MCQGDLTVNAGRGGTLTPREKKLAAWLGFTLCPLAIPGVIVHIPIRRFLLVAHVLLPEQIVAVVEIVGGGHVGGPKGILILLDRHLDIDGTDLRVGDGGAGIARGFAKIPLMFLLSLAPLHLRHVGHAVNGDLAVVGATEDQAADPAPEPFDERIEISFCHVAFSLS